MKIKQESVPRAKEHLTPNSALFSRSSNLTTLLPAETDLFPVEPVLQGWF